MQIKGHLIEYITFRVILMHDILFKFTGCPIIEENISFLCIQEENCLWLVPLVPKREIEDLYQKANLVYFFSRAERAFEA